MVDKHMSYSSHHRRPQPPNTRLNHLVKVKNIDRSLLLAILIHTPILSRRFLKTVRCETATKVTDHRQVGTTIRQAWEVYHLNNTALAMDTAGEGDTIIEVECQILVGIIEGLFNRLFQVATRLHQ